MQTAACLSNRLVEVTIRPEEAKDVAAIRAVTQAAFADKTYSQQNEHAIIDGLRKSGDLTLSLVAQLEGEVVGHIAFSPIIVDGQDHSWTGLGPVAVSPNLQQKGIGSQLIREGLARMKALGAGGCFLVGDPNYYSRFGFRSDPQIYVSWIEAPFYQWLAFGDDVPSGEVEYCAAFRDGIK